MTQDKLDEAAGVWLDANLSKVREVINECDVSKAIFLKPNVQGFPQDEVKRALRDVYISYAEKA